jgi:hypothetical protein
VKYSPYFYHLKKTIDLDINVKVYTIFETNTKEEVGWNSPNKSKVK